jgi:hypothetical protein
MYEPRSGPDRVLVAQLTGEAKHHAKYRPLTGAEEAQALAGLRELADGRSDLLAEVAGVIEGFAEPDDLRACQAAGLCRQAGGDPELVAAWIAEGQRRRANARMTPPSGGVHGSGGLSGR